ncbi:hypothetical protein Tco_0270740 [Tanacetum coccineum]
MLRLREAREANHAEGESSYMVNESALYYEAVGGVKKRNVYGLGSQASAYYPNPANKTSTTYMPHEPLENNCETPNGSIYWEPHIQGIPIPVEGTYFDTLEEVIDMYMTYAEMGGFEVKNQDKDECLFLLSKDEVKLAAFVEKLKSTKDEVKADVPNHPSRNTRDVIGGIFSILKPTQVDV